MSDYHNDSKNVFRGNQKTPGREARDSNPKAPGAKQAGIPAHSNEIDERIASLIGLKNFNDPKKSGNKFPQVGSRDGRCRVAVSSDFMDAYFYIEPPLGEGKWPVLEEAILAIKEAGVAAGYNLAAVKEAIENHLLTQVLIAKGTPPVHGIDTDLRIHHELKDLHRIYIEGLVEDNHGRVDFRQVKSVNSIEPGDLVAEKIVAIPGANGIDIRGQVIPAVQGRETEIKLGQNVTWDGEGLKVYATCGGKPMLINNCLHVLPIHEIEGNVNFRTGNVNFAGNLVIHGDVENGFKVEAEGEVLILGGVEGADITAGGKMSIMGGVFGMDKSKIVCGADFFAKQIERVSIKCKGTVMVKDAIMHSQVHAENKVIVEGGKGWIVGGSVHAGESIEAKTIGSRLGTHTELEVSEVYRHVKADASGHEDLADPGLVCENDFSPEAVQLSKTGNEGDPRVTRGRIKFKELLYPGVRLKFGPHYFVIENELSCATLYCNREGELRIIPLK